MLVVVLVSTATPLGSQSRKATPHHQREANFLYRARPIGNAYRVGVKRIERVTAMNATTQLNPDV